MFVCLFVCLFLSYSRPALAREHAGDYLGMATTAIPLFGLYRNYLGKPTDVLLRKTVPETESQNSQRFVCMGGENECLALVLATHADRFFLTKNVCEEGNAVPNIPAFVMIPLWLALMQATCSHDQSTIHVILVGLRQMSIELPIGSEKQI